MEYIEMRLADEPFEKIKSGEKTVEIRLIRLKVENKNRSQKSGRFFIGNVCLVLKIGQLTIDKQMFIPNARYNNRESRRT